MNKDTLKLLLITLILFTLAFCKSARADAVDDAELYFDLMASYRYWGVPSGLYGYKVQVRDALPQGWVGMCERKERVIAVQRDAYRQMSYTERMYVLAHEVGHCILGLEHSSDPNNIMYSHTVSASRQAIILKNMLEKGGK
jgi:hypothetical protein